VILSVLSFAEELVTIVSIGTRPITVNVKGIGPTRKRAVETFLALNHARLWVNQSVRLTIYARSHITPRFEFKHRHDVFTKHDSYVEGLASSHLRFLFALSSHLQRALSWGLYSGGLIAASVRKRECECLYSQTKKLNENKSIWAYSERRLTALEVVV
jgi:hypothetical protein